MERLGKSVKDEDFSCDDRYKMEITLEEEHTRDTSCRRKRRVKNLHGISDHSGRWHARYGHLTTPCEAKLF